MSDPNDVINHTTGSPTDAGEQTLNTGAPPMLPELRFDAYRVTSGNRLIYGFGPSAFDMTPALLQAGASTDRPHLIEVAERLKKGKAMTISRQQLTPKSMMALGIAIGKAQAAHLQPS